MPTIPWAGLRTMVAEAVLSAHARTEMARRGLTEAEVRGVLAALDNTAPVRPGRIVVQRTVVDPVDGQRRLIRVFVDVDRMPPVVVTAYRTSKLAKYGGVIEDHL